MGFAFYRLLHLCQSRGSVFRENLMAIISTAPVAVQPTTYGPGKPGNLEQLWFGTTLYQHGRLYNRFSTTVPGHKSLCDFVSDYFSFRDSKWRVITVCRTMRVWLYIFGFWKISTRVAGTVTGPGLRSLSAHVRPCLLVTRPTGTPSHRVIRVVEVRLVALPWVLLRLVLNWTASHFHSPSTQFHLS